MGMTSEDYNQINEILNTLINESPTIKRLINESQYSELGENFIVFQKLGKTYKLKIEVK